MHGGFAVDGSCCTRHVYETIVEATDSSARVHTGRLWVGCWFIRPEIARTQIGASY